VTFPNYTLGVPQLVFVFLVLLLLWWRRGRRQ